MGWYGTKKISDEMSSMHAERLSNGYIRVDDRSSKLVWLFDYDTLKTHSGPSGPGASIAKQVALKYKKGL